MKSMYSRKIACICKNEYEYFLNKCNVVGVGRGFKVKNGIITCEECIKVFVARKLSINQISCSDIIPELYKGIPTDVEESGYIEYQSLRERIRPTVGGYSIGSYVVSNSIASYAYTVNEDAKNIASIACLVTDGVHEYILSCNHGIVDRKYHKDVKILQPSSKDGGKYPEDAVAKLWKFIPVKAKSVTQKNENLVDSSISMVIDIRLAGPIIYGVGVPLGVAEAQLNQTVMKAGRSSGVTYGKIKAMDATYEVHDGFSTYIYIEQIMTSKMSESGDSGCALVNESRYVLGTCVASGRSTSMFCKIQNVLDLLGVQIVTH